MKLKLYMKSGNIIELRGIKDYTIGHTEDGTERLRIVRYWWCVGKIIGTLDLSQIEAVTVT